MWYKLKKFKRMIQGKEIFILPTPSVPGPPSQEQPLFSDSWVSSRDGPWAALLPSLG